MPSITSKKFYFSILLVGSMLVAAPAKAFDFVSAIVTIVLKDAAQQLLTMAFKQVFADNRQAGASAVVVSNKDVKVDATNWFGVAKAETASLADSYGSAQSTAINAWLDKQVLPVGKDLFGARAQIAWKGNVKMSREAGPLPAPEIPLPSAVQSASVSIQYQVAFHDTGASAGKNDPFHGADLGIALELNHDQVFEGGVQTILGGDPTFSGDLAAYRDNFVLTPSSFIAPSLVITGTYEMPIDYDAFFLNQEIVLEAAGSAIANAKGVPEPNTWVMMLAGFCAAGFSMRRSARSIRYAGLRHF